MDSRLYDKNPLLLKVQERQVRNYMAIQLFSAASSEWRLLATSIFKQDIKPQFFLQTLKITALKVHWKRNGETARDLN